MNIIRRKHVQAFRRQRGASLIVVLVALLIMGFVAAALLRSVDTTTLIAGNLGFQKAALASGDAGTEAAITWLGANVTGNALHADIAASGYYSSNTATCDLTGQLTASDNDDDVNWSGGAASSDCPMVAINVATAGVAAGYTVSYVINRMCNAAGNPESVVAADGVTPMICSRQAVADSSTSTRAGGSYGSLPLSGAPQTYYRITTRIAGPRNTVRYVQAFVVI